MGATRLVLRSSAVIGLLMALLGGTTACGSSNEATRPKPTGSATSTSTPAATDRLSGLAGPLQAAVTADVEAEPQLVGQIVVVRAGNERVDAGAGSADPVGGQAIDPSMSLRIASVTKTFVAAATLRLVETGAFALDDRIGPLLPAGLVDLLRQGGYRPDTITVRQLLTHTSGLLDFTFGPGMNYVERVLKNPQHEWSRREQVQLAMSGRPVGAPGTTYHYSDTGYALLGAILERATSEQLGTALRSLLRFDRLGLDHTYLELEERPPPRTPRRIHQFFGTRDTYGWSPTIDLFGGGGLVSTLDDLVEFFGALLDGRVFDEPGTLDLMLEIPPTNVDVRIPGDPRSYGAAAGLFRSEIGGVVCYGHQGFWGRTAQPPPRPAVDIDPIEATSPAEPQTIAEAHAIVQAGFIVIDVGEQHDFDKADGNADEDDFRAVLEDASTPYFMKRAIELLLESGEYEQYETIDTCSWSCLGSKALDIASYIPGVGDVIDGIRAANALFHGDYAKALMYAGGLVPIPGVTGTGLKLVKEGVEEVAEEIAERGIKEGIEEFEQHAFKDAAQTAKRGPKPWPMGPHNQTIQRRIGELESDGMTHLNGGSLPEEVVQIPAGGCKTCRRPDITMQRPDGSIYRENVGRTLADGTPVPREVSALDDLELASGSRPGYTAYDR